MRSNDIRSWWLNHKKININTEEITQTSIRICSIPEPENSTWNPSVLIHAFVLWSLTNPLRLEQMLTTSCCQHWLAQQSQPVVHLQEWRFLNDFKMFSADNGWPASSMGVSELSGTKITTKNTCFKRAKATINQTDRTKSKPTLAHTSCTRMLQSRLYLPEQAPPLHSKDPDWISTKTKGLCPWMSNRAHCWHWKILIADVHEKNYFQALQQEVMYKNRIINRIMYALCTQNFQQYSKLRMGQ